MNQEKIEKYKHTLALELEKEKFELRKSEIAYLEAGQHLRSLNQLLWQVPGITTAITGGLWYGATTISGRYPKSGLFGFVALANFLTIIIIWRLRELIQSYITTQNKFVGPPTELRASKSRRNVMVICWSFILTGAMILSILGVLFPDSVQKAPSLEEKPVAHLSATGNQQKEQKFERKLNETENAAKSTEKQNSKSETSK